MIWPREIFRGFFIHESFEVNAAGQFIKLIYLLSIKAELYYFVLQNFAFKLKIGK